jgi:hypothetical protein
MLNAQDPVRFSYSKERTNEEEVVLSIKAAVKAGIKLYAVQQSSADVVNSSISFDSVYTKYLNGTIIEKTDIKAEKDATLNAEVNYFTDSTLWQQKVKVNAGDSVVLKGTISYMFKEGDEYKPGEEKFKFFIQPAAVVNYVSATEGNSVE